MKTLFILLVIFTFAEPISSPYCKCEGSESINAEIEQSDLVIIGDVVKKNIISKFVKNDNGQKQNLLLVQYEIKVHKSYKGVNKDKKIFLYTTRGGASCGLTLEAGNQYIIFGTRGTYIPSKLEKVLNNFERNSYWSSSCSKTELSNIETKHQIEESFKR